MRCDSSSTTATSGRASGAIALRAGTRLSLTCEPGHAWFGRTGSTVLVTAESASIFAAAERRLAQTMRPTGKRPTRIPHRDQVAVASTPWPPAPSARLLQIPAPASGPTVAPQPSSSGGTEAGRVGSMSIPPGIRSALFMAILTATLALAWLSGRMMGWENVIVVPSPGHGHAVG